MPPGPSSAPQKESALTLTRASSKLTVPPWNCASLNDAGAFFAFGGQYVAEAERAGWLGEAEGLRVSLAGAEDKLGQINRRAQTAPTSVGMPTIRSTDRE